MNNPRNNTSAKKNSSYTKNIKDNLDTMNSFGANMDKQSNENAQTIAKLITMFLIQTAEKIRVDKSNSVAVSGHK